MKLSDKTIAILALVVVSAGYSLLSVAARLLSQGFGPFTQVYVRIGAAVLLTIIFLHRNLRWKHMKKIPPKDWLILTMMGTVGYAIGVYFITVGALNTKLINVAVIFSTVPLFVYFFSLFFLKRSLNLLLLLTTIASIIGVWMVSTRSFIPVFAEFGKGEIYVLLAAITMSTYFVGLKMLSKHLNKSEITFLVMSIAFVCSLIIAFIQGETLSLLGFTNPYVLLGLLIGAGFNIVSNLFNTYAFSHLNETLASQILLSENIFSLIFGLLFYHEFISSPELVGSLVIISCAYISNKLLS